MFCGIALAAGALTLASIASVIGGSEWQNVGRACLLAGCIGYLVAMLGMIANEPTDNYWRTLFQGWTPRSILSGAAWTVILLALLLFIEFLPQYSLRLTRARWFAILRRLDLPLLILATILAVLHQFGLNRLIKLAETRFSPLWSGPELVPDVLSVFPGGGTCRTPVCFLEEPAGLRQDAAGIRVAGTSHASSPR